MTREKKQSRRHSISPSLLTGEPIVFEQSQPEEQKQLRNFSLLHSFIMFRQLGNRRTWRTWRAW